MKKTIGDRLRANGYYAPLLEEKPRCWRLSYANEFHLDITPSIPNLECANGGEPCGQDPEGVEGLKPRG